MVRHPAPNLFNPPPPSCVVEPSLVPRELLHQTSLRQIEDPQPPVPASAQEPVACRETGAERDPVWTERDEG